jgi:hypothetical protein
LLGSAQTWSAAPWLHGWASVEHGSGIFMFGRIK